MRIDWFTTLAQIVNFLLLVVVLRWALWDRVTQAIDARRRSVEESREEASRLAEQARERLDEVTRREKELAETRDEFLAEARESAKTERLRLLEEARGEVDERRQRWIGALAEREREFLTDLRRRATEDVFLAIDRVLTDLADARLGEAVVRRFLHLLREADDASLEALRGADEWIVRTAAELPSQLADDVVAGIRKSLGTDVTPRLEVDPALLCGISLSTRDHVLAWTAREHLDALTNRVAQALTDELAAARPAQDDALEEVQERDEPSGA